MNAETNETIEWWDLPFNGTQAAWPSMFHAFTYQGGRHQHGKDNGGSHDKVDMNELTNQDNRRFVPLKPCPAMPANSTLDSVNPFRQSYRDLGTQFATRCYRILQHHGEELRDIHVLYECQFEEQVTRGGLLPTTSTEISSSSCCSSSSFSSPMARHFKQHPDKSPPPPMMSPRAFLRGGCVENYSLLEEVVPEWDVETESWRLPQMELRMLDINSLYPYLAIEKSFAHGTGYHLRGRRLLSRLSMNQDHQSFVYQDPETNQLRACDGILQVIIGAKRDNKLNNIPFLPVKHREKTYRALCMACLTQSITDLCPHSMELRRWRGTYSCAEIFYAVCVLGDYELFAIEEALIYATKSHLFRNYMKLLAAKKIAHQPVPEPFCHDLDSYCKDINASLYLTTPEEQITPNMLAPNKSMAAFYKDQMNIGAYFFLTLNNAIPFFFHCLFFVVVFRHWEVISTTKPDHDIFYHFS